MVDQKTQQGPLPSMEDAEIVHLPELPLRVRITFLVLGWLMVLLGIAGIFLPVLQGFAFIFIGLVMLSIASERLHGWLERALSRYPGIRQRYQQLRQKLHLKFGPKT